MKTIYKYPITETDLQGVKMPQYAKIVHVGKDPRGDLCLWAEVDTAYEMETVPIYIIGTGNPMPPEPVNFIGTVKVDIYMWHVYQAVPTS